MSWWLWGRSYDFRKDSGLWLTELNKFYHFPCSQLISFYFRDPQERWQWIWYMSSPYMTWNVFKCVFWAYVVAKPVPLIGPKTIARWLILHHLCYEKGSRLDHTCSNKQQALWGRVIKGINTSRSLIWLPLCSLVLGCPTKEFRWVTHSVLQKINKGQHITVQSNLKSEYKQRNHCRDAQRSHGTSLHL